MKQMKRARGAPSGRFCQLWIHQDFRDWYVTVSIFFWSESIKRILVDIFRVSCNILLEKLLKRKLMRNKWSTTGRHQVVAIGNIWHQNDTKITPERHYHDNKITIKLHKKIDTKMTQKWHKNDTKMTLKWHENDTKMTQKMNQKWH